MNSRHTQQYAIISTAFFFVGILFFAIYNQWIIFNWSWRAHSMATSSEIIKKKEVVHHYFHNEKWKTEKQEILWRENTQENIYHLVNAWLALLDQEQIIVKKTALQSVLVSQSGTAYLSLDHNILAKEETIFKKWMAIEGLLKTIAVNHIPVTHIQLFVQHQPLQDAHLDFSLAWPIYGFIT